jgi:CRISPR-associated protein Cas2
VELTTYVFYDIESDRIRAKVADACLDYGLDRLQFSVFIGPMTRSRREEIFGKLTDLLGGTAGKIVVQPVCDPDFRSRRVLAIEAKEKAATDSKQPEADRTVGAVTPETR